MEKDFLLDGIGGKHVAATYFNTAFENFYKTIGYILKQIDLSESCLGKYFDYKEEKIADVLQALYALTFLDESKKDETYEYIRKYLYSKAIGTELGKRKAKIKEEDEKTQEKQYEGIKTKDIPLDDATIRDAQNKVEKSLDQIMKELKDKETLVISEDRLMRFQKLLFNKIPGFAAMMAEVVSHENKKIQNELNNENTNEDRKNELRSSQKGMTYKMLFEKVVLVAETLLYYRNFYTHKNPYNDCDSQRKQNERECKLFFLVKSVFDGSRRIDKRRNLVPTEEMKHLTGNGDGQRKKKEKIEGKTKDNGQPIFRFIESDEFYFKIIGDQYINDKVKGHTLSDFGRMLFCCMFLSRHDILQFVEKERLMEQSPFKLKDDKLHQKQKEANKRRDVENAERATKGFKPLPPVIVKVYESETNKIVKDIMCLYHIRLPRERRIDSQETKETLTMDILNELRKCPQALYESFDAKGKEKFERKVTPDEKNGTPETVKMIRSSDRFPHLALRYIDEMKALGDIRFQVRLGRYRYCFYNKICIDGKSDIRVWQKEINGFGLYQDVEAKRKKDWEKRFQDSEEKVVEQKYGDAELVQLEKDKEGQKDYVTDSKTAYNIHANRIGMTWGLEDGIHFPDLGRELKEKTDEKELYKAPESKVNMLTPKCTMSIYDLPALLFYKYLYDEFGSRYKDCLNAEQIIKNKYEGLVALFTAVREGKSQKDLKALMMEKKLKESEIPKKILSYLELDQNYKTKQFRKDLDYEKRLHAYRCLLEIQEKAKRRLDGFNKKTSKIESCDNDYGKKGYADIRHGSIARYLAQSLVKWQPTNNDGKDKITGLNFNKLMAFLSSYGQKSNIEDLKTLLTNSGLIGSKNPHPFISKVLEKTPSHIEAFYKLYLNQEINYCTSLMDKIYISCVGDNNLFDLLRKDIKEQKNMLYNKPFDGSGTIKYISTSIVEWMNRDLRRLEPISRDVSDEINDSLSSLLEKFDYKILRDRFIEHGILSNDSSHPFLLKVFNEYRFFDLFNFCKSYLKEELSYITEIQNKKPITEEELNLLPFVHAKGKRWSVGEGNVESYYKHYASRYLAIDEKHDAIIMLPDGLFTDAIVGLLTAMCNDKTNKTIEGHRDELRRILEAKSGDEKNTPLCQNASYLIQSYFNVVMQDENQPFYNAEGIYKRAYRPFTTLFGTPIGSTTELERYYMNASTLKQKMKVKDEEITEKLETRNNIKDKEASVASIKSQIKEVKDIERGIRRFKTQDVTLFLAARKLLISILSDGKDKNNESVKNLMEKANKLKLKDFTFDDGFKFLNEGKDGVNLSYKYKYKGIEITQEGLSLKNYGNIYRVLSDSRFASLMDGLEKIGVTSVTFGDLTSEFAIYDDKRPDIFMTIQEIEEKAKKENEVILNDPSNKDFYSYDKDGNKMAKLNSFNALVNLLQEYDDDDKSVMIDIRNAAGHGHYRLKLKFNELEKEKEQTYNVPNIARFMNETMTKRKEHKNKKKEEKKESK